MAVLVIGGEVFGFALWPPRVFAAGSQVAIIYSSSRTAGLL